MWCWPGADSQTQSAQPEEGNSTSKCGVMVQRASNLTHAASAEHMLNPSSYLHYCLLRRKKWEIFMNAYECYMMLPLIHICIDTVYGQKYMDNSVFCFGAVFRVLS